MADTTLISLRIPNELLGEADRVSEVEDRSRAQILIRWMVTGYEYEKPKTESGSVNENSGFIYDRPGDGMPGTRITPVKSQELPRRPVPMKEAPGMSGEPVNKEPYYPGPMTTAPMISPEDLLAKIKEEDGLKEMAAARTLTETETAVFTKVIPDAGAVGRLVEAAKAHKERLAALDEKAAPVEVHPVRDFPTPRCPKCRIEMTDEGDVFVCKKGVCRQKPIPVEEVRERYERERGE